MATGWNEWVAHTDAMPELIFCGFCGHHYVAPQMLLSRCTACGEVTVPEPSDWAAAISDDALSVVTADAIWPISDEELYAV